MRHLLLSLFLMVAVPLAASAADNPFKQRTEYAADVKVTSSEFNSSGRVYQSKSAERREMTVQGQNAIIIIREKEVLMLTAGTPFALRMETSEDPLDQIRQADAATFKKLGEETVNGERADKYEVQDENATGYFWATRDGIMMRAEITPKDQGKMVVDTLNVRRGAQPSSLFELPAGTKIVDMGKPGQIDAKGLIGLQGQTQNDDDAQAAAEKPSEGFGDALGKSLGKSLGDQLGGKLGKLPFSR